MQERSRRKRPNDPNELAALIAAITTADPEAEPAPDADAPPAVEAEAPPVDTRNPAAVALGKLGGAKGGAARAAKLSAERRREIARNAADAMWAKKRAGRAESGSARAES